MSTRGANVSTRASISHRHVESFGKVRSQTLDTQIIRGESCAMDTATFQACTTDTLTVTDGITTPRITLNGAGGKVILATSAAAYTGENGVIIGSTASAADNTIIIGANNFVTSAGAFSVVIGHDNTGAGQVDGDHNIVLGRGDVNETAYNVMVGFGTTAAIGDFSCVFGRDASSSGTRNVVIGNTSSVDDDDCVAIGSSSTVSGAPFGVAIGLSARVTGDGGVAVGANSNVAEDDSIALGNNSNARGRENVVIGKDASTSAVFGAVSIGRAAAADGTYSVAIGSASSVSGQGVAVGKATTTVTGVSVGTDASCDSGVAVGNQATAAGTGICIGELSYTVTNSAVIGSGVTALSEECIAIGRNSNCGGRIVSFSKTGAAFPVTSESIVQLVCTQYTVFDPTSYIITFTSSTEYLLTVNGESLGTGTVKSTTYNDKPDSFGRGGTVYIRFTVVTPMNIDRTEVDFSAGDTITFSVSEPAPNDPPSITFGTYTHAGTGSVTIGYNISAERLSVVIGSNNRGKFDKAVVIGTGCVAKSYGALSGYSSVLIGDNVQTFGDSGVVVGAESFAAGKAVAIGSEARARALNSVSIGSGTGSRFATSQSYNNTAIGAFSLDGLTSGTNNTAIGTASGSRITTGSKNVIIGGLFADVQTGSDSRAVAIGDAARTTSYTVSIGASAVASTAGTNSVVIGRSATVTADEGVAIGRSAASGFAGSAVLGANCAARIANETVLQGLRVVRATASGDLSSGSTLIDFPVSTTNEIVSVSAVVTVFDATGGVYAIFTFRDYLFANDGSTTLATVAGSLTSQSTAATSDTCTLTGPATTDTVRLTVTAADTNARSVVAVMQISGGDLV